MCNQHRQEGSAAMARRDVRSEVAGRVWKIEAEVGRRVAAADPILILESMKMEIPVHAPVAGTVAAILVEPEEMVEEDQVVATLET
jgi:acetyl-CoA carboxylase biotin carboxyl carrier protein